MPTSWKKHKYEGFVIHSLSFANEKNKYKEIKESSDSTITVTTVFHLLGNQNDKDYLKPEKAKPPLDSFDYFVCWSSVSSVVLGTKRKKRKTQENLVVHSLPSVSSATKQRTNTIFIQNQDRKQKYSYIPLLAVGLAAG